MQDRSLSLGKIDFYLNKETKTRTHMTTTIFGEWIFDGNERVLGVRMS